MAENAKAFTPVPRRVVKDPLFLEPEKFGAYTILQLRACFAPQVVELTQFTSIRLMPGQLLYSERMMTEWTGWPRSKVRQVMGEFEEQGRISYPAGTEYPHPYVLELKDPWTLYLRPGVRNGFENPENRTRAGPVAGQRDPPEKKGKRNQEGTGKQARERRAEPEKASDKTKPTQPKSKAGEGVVVSTAPKRNRDLVYPAERSKGMRADRKVRTVENRPDVPSIEEFKVDPRQQQNQARREEEGGYKGEKEGHLPSTAVPVSSETPLSSPPTPPALLPNGTGGRSAPPSALPPQAPLDEVFASLQRRINDIGLRGHAPQGRFARDDAAALQQLVRERGAQAIERAIEGMGRLYPFSAGRPWSARTLAEKFDLAFANALPQAGAEKATRSTLLQRAQQAHEERMAEWQARAERRWADAPEDLRSMLLERADAEVAAPPGATAAFERIRKRTVRELAMMELASSQGDPAPQKPELLK